MQTLDEKAKGLRQMRYPAENPGWKRPAVGTVGLTISEEGFDEQFVDQFLGGASIEEVRSNRDRWLDLVAKERGK
jgi:hypothetical protein